MRMPGQRDSHPGPRGIRELRSLSPVFPISRKAQPFQVAPVPVFYSASRIDGAKVASFSTVISNGADMKNSSKTMAAILFIIAAAKWGMVL